MSALQQLKSHLRPGAVYRRADLAKWSNAVDRHLRQLQEEKTLQKLSGGLYFYPKKTVFGFLPPDDKTRVASFLKDHRFLLLTSNVYNTLGLGTTQLYSETLVYNHKRHGTFKLGARTYRFVMKHHCPAHLTLEFLLVSLFDERHRLAENQDTLLSFLKKKIQEMDPQKLRRAVQNYGSVRAKKFFEQEMGRAL